MPPESRGAVIACIADAALRPENINNLELRQLAAFSTNELVATIQSAGHFNNTLDRITIALGEESDRDHGLNIVSSIVAGTKFDNCIDRCELQLARAAPLKGRPFMRNDEPDFLLTQLSLHHPGYNIA
jgi:hypothetical protein